MRLVPSLPMIWLLVVLVLLGAPPVDAVSVRDDLERPVSLAEAPSRIAALAPHAVEMLFYLGLGERVVATVEHADYPEEALDIPRVGDAFALSLEALVERRPQLVVAWGSAVGPRTLARMEDLGLTVYVSEPAGLDGVLENLRELEALAGGGEASARFASGIEGLAPAPAAPSAAFLVGHTPLLAVSRQHFLGDLLERCGARNPFADMAGSVVRISAEALLAEEPGHVAFPSTPDEESSERAWGRRLEALGLGGTALPIAADLVARPGPRLLEGARHLCRALEGGT